MKAPVAHDGYGRVAVRLLRWALAIGAVFGSLCFGPSVLMTLLGEGDQKGDRARLDVVNLHRAMGAYRARNGNWPPEDLWVEALVDAGILGSAPLDPWDHPYQYRLEASDGGQDRPVVSSMGRDGAENTEDDLPRPASFVAP